MDQHVAKDQQFKTLNESKQNLEAALLQGGGAASTPKGGKMGEIESPTKLPGPKKALSTLYSDQVSAVKKSVKNKIDAAMTD